LPWPCAAVAAARAGAAGRGSSRRPGPPEVSGSRSTPCRGPPCTCGESVENRPYPAGGGGKKRCIGEIEGGGSREEGACKRKERQIEAGGGAVFLMGQICVSCLCA